jgi:hypothetical protein
MIFINLNKQKSITVLTIHRGNMGIMTKNLDN